MFYLPTLPPWDGLHPLVIHFPIALVFVSPLLILLAMLWKQQTRTLLIVATLMMLLAAAGAWLATSTSGAAEEFAENVPGAKSILHEHEELGEAARNFTTALAIVLLVATAAFCKWNAKVPRAATLIGGLIFLLANGSTALVIANAAHEGGRLVHEVGVRARLAPGGASGQASPASRGRAPDGD
jgi:uncharacterized membrane protein